jgi:hypothetical protein
MALHMKIDQLRDEQMKRMIELEDKHLEILGENPQSLIPI